MKLNCKKKKKDKCSVYVILLDTFSCCRWKALQGALELYREKLANALDVHAFNRDVDDTNDRINEKV